MSDFPRSVECRKCKGSGEVMGPLTGRFTVVVNGRSVPATKPMMWRRCDRCGGTGVDRLRNLRPDAFGIE